MDIKIEYNDCVQTEQTNYNKLRFKTRLFCQNNCLWVTVARGLTLYKK